MPSHSLEYVPWEGLGEHPSIVVDGRPHASSVLTLSHWPRSGTPRSLAADTSTGIALRYLERPDLRIEEADVSNTHFDEDGLAGMFCVLHPEAALARRAGLLDYASAGDFGTCRSPKAALATFVTNAWADPERSPLGARFFEASEGEVTAGLYRALLDRLVELLERPETHRSLWEEEAAFLKASEEAVRRGVVRIEEHPELDLAIVTVPEDRRLVRIRRVGQTWQRACHPMAIYGATTCLRVLWVQGRRYELEYRYESWVEYASRRPLGRVDLAPLAEELGASERGRARWRFDGVDAITPSLRTEDGEESSLPLATLWEALGRALRTGPVAWDPYAGRTGAGRRGSPETSAA